MQIKRKPSAGNPPLLFRSLLRGYLRWQVVFLFDGTRSYSIADYDENINNLLSNLSAARGEGAGGGQDVMLANGTEACVCLPIARREERLLKMFIVV